MANDAAPLKAIAGSLEHQALDPIFTRATIEALNGAASILQDHEQEARKRAEARFDAALRSYVTESRLYQFGGLSNAISSIATLCEKLSEEQPEYSEADADYQFAAKVLEAASNAVDLNYGDRSTERRRKEALAQLVAAVAEIKP